MKKPALWRAFKCERGDYSTLLMENRYKTPFVATLGLLCCDGCCNGLVKRGTNALQHYATLGCSMLAAMKQWAECRCRQ